MFSKINRFGEIRYSKNEILFTIPTLRLEIDDIELLEENYRQKIKELEYTDSFLYADHISLLRERVQINFTSDDYMEFSLLNKMKLKEKLPYFESMVEISKQDVKVLWERNNFMVSVGEKKVKAIIFEFEGFPIYKKDTNVDGLKELILLALTKNENILGRPKKTDFVEQNDLIYQFADDLLVSESIEDIEKVIKAYIFHFHEIENKKNEKKKRKRKKEKPIRSEKKPKKRRHISFDKSFLMKTGVVLILLTIIVFVLTNLDLFTNKSADALNQDILVEAIREASLKNYDASADLFDKLDYGSLIDDDKDVMLLSYLFTDQADKALALEPKFDETVVSYYKATHAMYELRELNEKISSKVIEYEIAVSDRDFSKVVELRNDVKLKDGREIEIIDSFLNLDDVDGAKEFAKENNLDDILADINEMEESENNKEGK